jgi:hypothetical protein
MWGNPVTGHLLSTTDSGQVIDIDPNANGGAGSSTVIATPGLVFDGVTVSPDGTIVYTVENFHIIGRNILSHAQVYDSGLLAGQPDGIGVITSSNSLNGKFIVNFNAGTVGLLDPSNNSVVTIASGGTRGDYIAVDPSNGSVFLDYSDLVYRLACGASCSIGTPITPSGPSPTPAPSTLLLLITGVAGLGVYWGWKKRHVLVKLRY